MQKVILKVDWSCEKSKKKAIKIVSKNTEVRAFAVDEEKKRLTVDGDMDPVSLVIKMRRQFPATEIVFMESEASRALEAPPATPKPSPRDETPAAPPYGHPIHPNPYWGPPAPPPYWDNYGSYWPQ